MRYLIAILIGTIVLAACSSRAASTSTPSAHPPSLTPDASETATTPPTPAPTAAPTPSPEASSVSLAAVQIRTVADRPAADGCTPDDWAAPGLDPAMALAGTPIRFQVQSGGSRGEGGAWGDEVPGPTIRFAPDGAQVVETDAGTVARLEPATTVTLVDGTLSLYRLGPDDTLDPGAAVVATARLGGDSDGLDVPMPVDAGRWLLSLYGHWQTDCGQGDGYVDLLLITA